MNDESLLDLCERYYRTFGYLPLTLFAMLVQRDYSPTELERKWSD